MQSISDSERVESFLQKSIESVLQRTLSTTPPNLSESIRYSLLAPGKRIRPRIVLASARMLGVSSEAALHLGAAIEMIHCFTLIHDDLPCMDNDDFRRGRPSNHKVFGESIALLAGNGLMASAFELITQIRNLSVPSEGVFQALVRLLEVSGPRGVLGGQAQEFLLSSQSSLDELKQMFAGKTGALFVAAVMMPADLSLLDRQPKKHRALQEFADALGFAFQVMDDFDDAPEKTSPERQKPTNILFYLDEAHAAEEGRNPLLAAIALCEAEFGQKEFSEMKEIAFEVLRKIPA